MTHLSHDFDPAQQQQQLLKSIFLHCLKIVLQTNKEIKGLSDKLEICLLFVFHGDDELRDCKTLGENIF